MSLIKYRCLVCGRDWGDIDADDTEISHGYCKRCLQELMKEKIWRRQSQEGFNECFARGYEDCTEYKCAHWEICLQYVIDQWERENINGNGEDSTDV